MKTQVLFIALLVVSASVLPLQAQFYVGVQGGAGFATQKVVRSWTDSDFGVDFGQLIRPLGGFVGGYQFSNSIAMQAEINYVTKGSYYPYQEIDPIESSTLSVSYGYYEMPLLVRYTLPQIVSSLDVHLLAGPSISILESGHYKGYGDFTRTITYNDNEITLIRREYVDEKTDMEGYRSYDISIGGGLGVSYVVSSVGRVFCTGRYMVGLTDIEPRVDFSKQNRTLHLSLGYMLTL